MFEDKVSENVCLPIQLFWSVSSFRPVGQAQ